MDQQAEKSSLSAVDEGEIVFENQNSQNFSKSSESSTSPPDSSPGREAIKKLFHKEVKIVLADDRVIIGSFFCTDKDCNIVLGGAREFENEVEFLLGKQEPRFIGLVMVNKKNTKALFVDVKESSSGF